MLGSILNARYALAGRRIERVRLGPGADPTEILLDLDNGRTVTIAAHLDGDTKAPPGALCLLSEVRQRPC